MFSVSRMIVVLLFYVHGKLLRVMSGWSVNLTTRIVSKIWDQQGPHMGFYMGPIWASHMGLGLDL